MAKVEEGGYVPEKKQPGKMLKTHKVCVYLEKNVLVHSRDRVDRHAHEPIQKSCSMFKVFSAYFVFPV